MRADQPHLLHAPRARWLAAALVMAAFALGGCASGPRTITSQVQSYASMQQVRLPTTYRMEILPSQEQQTSFSQIEYAAQEALQRAGLKRAAQPEQARLVVQVGASASQGRAYHPSYDPYFYGGPRFGWGLGYGGGWHGSWGMRWMMDTPPMVYLRAVKLVLRDAQSQRIVYETSAQHDEVSVDDSRIWQVLFDAALSDFPNPPQGPRQVQTTLSAPQPKAQGQELPAAATPANSATPAAVPRN